MASTRFARSVAVRSLPLVAASWGVDQKQQNPVTSCEAPSFQKATCTKNEAHTHDTRLITLKLPSNWNDKGAVANVVVRAEIKGETESGCCACCGCKGTCSCPKQANGCCACCKCDGTCGCAKTVAKDPLADGCCACCKCAPPCSCPKTESGCCACCSCKGTCGCAKAVPSSTASSSGSTMVARPYNPLSATSGDTVTLLVKRYGETAKMGSKLHELKEGDTVEVKGPNKQWSIPEPGTIKKYAMVAGGTGVTPIVQATRAILENDSEATVEVFTFNKSLSDTLLLGALLVLKMEHPSRLFVKSYVASTENPEDFRKINGYGLLLKLMPKPTEGQPNRELLEKVLPKPSDHEGKVMVCVCGRPGMTGAVAGPKTKDYKQGEVGGILKELGFSKDQVRKF